MDLFLVSNGAGAFDAAGDAIEDLKAGAWVLACGGFSGKHDGIGAFENGIGDIGDLGARREGIGDHALQHVSGDDDGLHRADALFHNFALNDGEFLVRALHSEVSTGDHDGVCSGDDAEDIFDGQLVFDLSDNFHVLGFVLV